MRIALSLAIGHMVLIVSAVPHERRQLDPILGFFGGNSQSNPLGLQIIPIVASFADFIASSFADFMAEKPAKVTDIQGENHTRPGSKHRRYWFGPYDIPAGKARATPFSNTRVHELTDTD
jgi:hypothetical protein